MNHYVHNTCLLSHNSKTKARGIGQTYGACEHIRYIRQDSERFSAERGLGGEWLEETGECMRRRQLRLIAFS